MPPPECQHPDPWATSPHLPLATSLPPHCGTRLSDFLTKIVISLSSLPAPVCRETCPLILALACAVGAF